MCTRKIKMDECDFFHFDFFLNDAEYYNAAFDILALCVYLYTRQRVYSYTVRN